MPPTRIDQSELQRILDAVLDGIVVLSASGGIERINDEACRILETSAELAVGRSFADFVGSDHPTLHMAIRVQETRRPRVGDDILLERRFGSPLEVDVAVSARPDEDDQTAGVVVVLRDRTIGNTLRAERSQREQLASYGHIAAGIAHEVKNPLGGIRGAAELLTLRGADERTKRSADLIVREVDRITALVDELMVFAKGEALAPVPVNLHRLIDEMLELIQADPMASEVRFERAYDPSIPDLLGDPNRLTQVFLNLTRNAIQAIGESGGQLTITTRMALARRLVGPDGRARATVEIIFDDDGPGIPPEIMDRLATPFFTTRQSGTGLGLAVSRHWVTRHGGRMQITSNPGDGARILVALPLAGPLISNQGDTE
jgi:two-component system nitrogen regulation sensor histidine kinase GlnL